MRRYANAREVNLVARAEGSYGVAAAAGEARSAGDAAAIGDAVGDADSSGVASPDDGVGGFAAAACCTGFGGAATVSIDSTV